MIKKFSIYGFLKNLQFFDPFIILYFLNIGLSFFQIGILISFKTICVNIIEIPSGAIADLYGRKNSLIFSLLCYITSFIIFSLSKSYFVLFPAMFLFSLGEAFRSGTHKAMIFDWLRINNKLNKSTKIYGYTRSWSKIGSATSVVISASIVIITNNYSWVFLASIIPYILCIWNIASYPSYLNNLEKKVKIKPKDIYSHLINSFFNIIKIKKIRELFIKVMGFEGAFKISKDYLQPILQSQALIFSAVINLPKKDSTAIIISIVYFILYIISAGASRQSYKIIEKTKSEDKATLLLTALSAFIILTASISLYYKIYFITIICFILFFMIQNIWRPIIISQYDNIPNTNQQATIFSIESQTKEAGIFIMAPITGKIADNFGIEGSLFFISVILILLTFYSYTKIKIS